jgi:hypothetical protein
VTQAISEHVVVALEVARNARSKMRPGGTLLLMGGTSASGSVMVSHRLRCHRRAATLKSPTASPIAFHHSGNAAVRSPSTTARGYDDPADGEGLAASDLTSLLEVAVFPRRTSITIEAMNTQTQNGRMLR